MPSTNVLIGVALAVLAALVVLAVVMFSGGGSGGRRCHGGGCREGAHRGRGRRRHARPAARGWVRAAHGRPEPACDVPDVSGVERHPQPDDVDLGQLPEPVDPRQAVHNLEHGGVAIWYGPDISAADRAALDRFYEEDENGLIITPIPDPYPGVTYPKHDKLGSQIALTAWTAAEEKPGTAYIATLPSFDQRAFAAFRDAFRGKGPERFPVSQMVPGGN